MAKNIVNAGIIIAGLSLIGIMLVDVFLKHRAARRDPLATFTIPGPDSDILNPSPCIAIGLRAVAEGPNSVSLGTDSHSGPDEICIKFTDGTQWRSELPHKAIDILNLFGHGAEGKEGR